MDTLPNAQCNLYGNKLDSKVCTSHHFRAMLLTGPKAVGNKQLTPNALDGIQDAKHVHLVGAGATVREC